VSDMPLVDLERELVRAAARRVNRRRVPSRRTLLIAIGVATAMAVPAWATGLLRGAFPTAHESLPGIGRAYVVASGTTQRGEPWRFELTHGARFRNGAKGSGCAVLAVGGGQGFAQCVGGGPQAGPGGGIGTLASVSRRDHRRLLVASVPLRVKTVAVRFASGRQLRVTPLAVDQARARRTGIRFPAGFVAVAYPRADRLTGLLLLDARGRTVPMPGAQPRFTPSSAAPHVRSPAF
jgi:hypothetical protein